MRRFPAFFMLVVSLTAASTVAAQEMHVVDQQPAEAAPIKSMDFSDSLYPRHTCIAWDDFSLDQAITLTRGVAYFTENWGGDEVPFNVIISQTANGRPILTTSGAYDHATGRVSFTFPSVRLEPGFYWIAVQADGGFDRHGNIYWKRSNPGSPSGSEHLWHEPAGASELGTDLLESSVVFGEPADLAFTLFGDPRAAATPGATNAGADMPAGSRIAIAVVGLVCGVLALFGLMLLISGPLRRSLDARLAGRRA